MAHPSQILVRRKVARDTYEMTLSCPEIAHSAMPGNFVHIKVPQDSALLLRRPISIHRILKTQGAIVLIIQQKGPGTGRIVQAKVGEKLDLLGPLGNSFVLPQDAKRCALVGGGIGCAPLCTLAEAHPQVRFDSYMGFRSKDYVYGEEAFGQNSRLVLATDDGSAGYHGRVTELLAEGLEKEGYDAVFIFLHSKKL